MCRQPTTAPAPERRGVVRHALVHDGYRPLMTENTTTTRPLALGPGASPGIARALARQFAEHGFDLLIAADDDELEAATGEFSSYSVEVTSVRADLASPLGVETLHRAFSSSPRP